MVKGIYRFFLLGMILLAGVLLAACQPEQRMVTPAAPGISVSVSGDICPGVVVKAGEQVTWTNQDSSEHLTSHLPEAGDSLFNSGT